MIDKHSSQVSDQKLRRMKLNISDRPDVLDFIFLIFLISLFSEL
jgi:hypothetical protein